MSYELPVSEALSLATGDHPILLFRGVFVPFTLFVVYIDSH